VRKRSKYRPRNVIVNPIGYVIENMTPITQHDSFAVDLRLKNHLALTLLTQGRATRKDMDVLISALNMTESLWRLGHGREYRSVVDAGLRALRSVGSRGLATDKFILNATEMAAINEAMELHDAQLDVITVKDMDSALRIVYDEIKYKRATPIQEKNT
jgi:hypothetical protein